ncbi:hypothetical protein G5714_024640 [Onychostoma macrolepis]|uniref:Uncharacterized protein n=1 Tax=Onychostoma macrolepis TaxID=369639 RepID=A0A7J6BHP3_9TELE|nr:hypothetical protein G5714_024640 [Onychostoma macrolepis]
MSWRKGARRPVARRKSCRDRIAAATRQSANHYAIKSAGFEPARGDPNGFQVHRLNLSATTTPMTNCGPPAPLAAGGQHRTPPSVRLKIQLKDELAKRSPTSPLLDSKRLP